MTIVVNGWTLCPHPALLEQIEAVEAVAADQNNPQGPAAKVLRWLLESMLHDIPQNPALPVYRQGRTLGKDYTGWFRDKYAGRFRLFFRFDTETKTIVYGWVNDEQTKRTRGAKNDAYAVFKRMLDSGYPPNSWVQLVREASAPEAVARLEGLRDRNR